MSVSIFLDGLIRSGRLTEYTPQHVLAVDTDVIMNVGLKKPGYAGKIVVGAGTAAGTCTLTFYLQAQPGGTWAVDSAIGTAGVITFSATYTTVGTLVDYINTSTYWKARPMARLRADTVYDGTANSQILAAQTYYVAHGQECSILADTSAGYVSTNPTYSQTLGLRFGMTNCFGRTDKGIANIPLSLSLYASFSGTGTYYIYSVNNAAQTEKILYQGTLTTVTRLLLTEATLGYLPCLVGDELYVRITAVHSAASALVSPALVVNAARLQIGPGRPEWCESQI